MISSGGQSVEGREGRQGLRAAASPVAAVLVLAGVFHFYRGVPNEGVLFVAAGLAIAADGAGRLPTPRPRVFRLPGATVSFAIAVVGGAALALLTPQGAMETVVLAVVGVTAIVIGWLQPEREGDPSQFSGESRDAPAAELSTELDTELTPELTPEFAESSDSSGVAAAERSRTPPGGSSGASLDDSPRTAERYRRTAVVWLVLLRCRGVLVRIGGLSAVGPTAIRIPVPDTLDVAGTGGRGTGRAAAVAGGVDRPRIRPAALVAGRHGPLGGACCGRSAVISRLVVISVFVAFGVAAIVIDSMAHRSGSRLVPVAVLLQSAMGRRTVRIAVLLVWWWLGWHFLVEP